MSHEISTYVLITPARNEAQYIEAAIESVVAQDAKPLKWVIVSDGSTDGTDGIVGKYLAANPWIELLRMPERGERHFAGKAHAFNAGYRRVEELDFDVIGNLDADVTFGPDHFRYLVSRFNGDPRLGVVGSAFREGHSQYDYRFTGVENVWGGCQLFRRECFESIGGYVPVKGGGVDLIATVTARMNGWKSRTFTGRLCIHHRKMNSAMNSGLKLKFRWGQSDYRLGGHPAWELFRCVYQMRNRPYVVGGLLTLAGYYSALAARRPRSVSPDFIRFRGEEQMRRLRACFTGRFATREANG